MKKLITMTVALGALALTSMAFAQAAGPGGQGQGQQRQGRQGQEQMTPEQRQKLNEGVQAAHKNVLVELKLTDEQYGKIKELEAARDEATAELREQVQAGTLDRQAAMEKRREIQTTYRTGLRETLGDANWQTYQKRMFEETNKIRKELGLPELPAPGQGRRGGGGGNRGGN